MPTDFAVARISFTAEKVNYAYSISFVKCSPTKCIFVVNSFRAIQTLKKRDFRSFTAKRFLKKQQQQQDVVVERKYS